jgi:thymidylate synthase
MHAYDNFTQAYIDLCRMIRDYYDFEAAPRGMKIKEKLGVQFRIRDPRNRLPYVPARNFSVSYFVAEALWYMSGSNSTEWIARYAPFWKDISDDGETANSAYGARIFKPHPRIADGAVVQWDYVKSELQRDPDSRRAVIHIRTPDDSIYATKDVPCTLALQFFIRNDALHLHVSMRSSDIILGIAYDVPAFTLMQEVLANELGIGLGEYVHTSNSLHCYERDFDVLSAIASSDSDDALSMEPLPRAFPTTALMAIERDISRSSADSISATDWTRTPETDASASDALVNDWRRILASARLRKLRHREDALEVLRTTQFKGYQFFDR